MLNDGWSEKKLERHLVDLIEHYGGQCYKFKSPNRRGVPDRIITLHGGYVHFVEVKAWNGKTSGGQRREIKRLKALGQNVSVVYGCAQLEKLLGLMYRIAEMAKPDYL